MKIPAARSLEPPGDVLVSGYNGGAWNGLGIDCSNAAANPSYALGYADPAAIRGIPCGDDRDSRTGNSPAVAVVPTHLRADELREKKSLPPRPQENPTG